MAQRWLNFFFRFSGFVFGLKQKIVNSESLIKVLPEAFFLLLLEFVFAIVSLPMYLLVSPKVVQESGTIFPRATKEKVQFNTYVVRRKISLVTSLSAAIIFFSKLIFVGIVSLYLLGAQQLLAATQNWDFTTASEYVTSSSSIEFVGGTAQLKDLGTLVADSTTNPGLDTAVTGWAYNDWLDPGSVTVAGSRISPSGGNPGPYLNVSISISGSATVNRTGAGYWTQSFVTTVNSPDTATLNLDWSSITFTSPTPPATYRLYAFIETTPATTVPASTSSAVWDSGEITSATSWASISAVDIASSVPTAGTYYLKIAAYATSPKVTGSYVYIPGFDNIHVDWSKTTHVYDSTKPTVTPSSSLTMGKTVSWNSFAETATKNGGEIYYQLSGDNGATWKYWTAGAWTAAGASNYNIATDVNTNIGSFATSSNQIKYKAFLSSNGSQQVALDNIAIGYTENLAPTVTGLVPVQNTQNGYVFVNYNLNDTESDPSSLVNYEYSLTGAFAGEQVAMTASSTDPSHNGITSLSASPSGVAHTFVWDAKSQLGAVYNTTVYVRLRANDGIQSGVYVTSTAITVDYVNPVVTNVSASQPLNTTTVQISYDLSDNTTDNLFTDFQVSGDGGSTWTVATTSASGATGSGITAGTSRIIFWNAGINYNGYQQSNIQARVRSKDKWQNLNGYVTSTNFSLDTLAPATLVTADLKAQPNAGDTTVLVGGSFTETNPSTNTFYAAVTGGAYGGSSLGTSDTASPSNQATTVTTSLKGNDYISKVKITHTDDYGQSFDNENTSPSTTFKYVKPYTPAAPSLSNPITTQLDLLVNPNASEVGGLEYAIYETTTAKYIQANGTLGVSAVWQTTAVWGTKTITGLSSPVSQYIFQVKSRNTSDGAHAVSSESAFSATAQIPNTAPSIALNTYAQTTDGTDYVTIAYAGTDGQGDISSIPTYQYSTNNATWNTMTQKTGVGSNGTSSLVFLPMGSNYNFVWDSNTDLPNIETSTTKIRLKPNDSLIDGSTVTSNAFTVDHKAPVISAVTALQGAGTRMVTFSYTLTDANTSFVDLQVSNDGGVSWNVPTSTVSGDVGAGITPGAGKTITWNTGTDFNSQYNTNMKVHIRARDSFGNQGTYTPSSPFIVDTHAPVISNVTSTQDTAANTFTFHYDVSEDIGNATIVLAISSDGGSTWSVATSTAAGDIGSVTTGTNKTITWNGATNYNNQEKTNMQIRLTANDQYNNSSNLASSNFSLDALAPRVTAVSGLQSLGGTTVGFAYTLADQNNALVQIDISSDNGSTWTVPSSSLTGDIGTVAPGTKNITWNAKVDFPNQQNSNMKVRVRGNDIFNNQSANTTSTIFSMDTLNPAVLATADLKAQPLAGDTAVLVGGSFTEVNPNTNIFFVAIDDGSYGTGVTGTANTATPSDLSMAVGTTLKGNNYISKVKITHTDDYGQATDNENTSPTSGFKYVKPYTPAAPTVDNPTVGTVDVLVNKNVNEVTGLEYAIFETSQSKYVQANGTLGVSVVWQPLGTLVGQWGEFLSVSGKVRVNGLTTHSYLYQFQVKSRNSSDELNLPSSESAYSAGASSANQSPVIVINSVYQTTDGSKYVPINFTGSDLESESNILVKYEYSTDNSIWHTMTEKSGVGSNGTSSLAFANTGTAHLFAWDVGTDLNNTEDNTVYVRLQANDGTSNGNIAAASAFTVDTKNPDISSLTAAQVLWLHNVSIGYNLTDLNTSTVILNISSDGGSTWNVTSSTVSGAVGTGVTPGNGKSITWNALADFANQESNTMKVQIRATDSFGNQNTFVSSGNFTADTKVPVVSAVSAVQNSGNNFVTVTYNLSDASTSTVYLEVSADSGSNWTVTSTNVTGAVGANVLPGTGKTITWNAGIDFPSQQLATMRVRVRATDVYNNIGDNFESADFNLDSKAPLITNVSAAQIAGTDNFNFTYDLFDSDAVIISIDISSNDGLTWTVATSSLTGAVGSGVGPALGKTVSWNGATDFNNQQNTNMKIRVRGTDIFNNTSINFESAIFNLDTLSPAVATTANLKTQPNAGDTTALIGGSFTETNPLSNIFVAAVNGGAYAASTTGQAGTATPADQATAVGLTLTGSDYVSKVKIVETDNFGHSTSNENTSPNTAYKYVKPYTPVAPTVNNPLNTSADVTINAHASESSTVEYAIVEVSTNKYVQTNGTLASSSVWKTLGTGAGQWGVNSGVVGKITVNGLNSPVANYSFKVKSRNPADGAHAASSESDFSNITTITNTAPTIAIASANQANNTNYVVINYTGTDGQNDTNNLTSFEFSTNTINWFTMTEKSGVGSSGTNNLIFSSTGTAYNFAWNIATDLPNTEAPTVYARLQSSDTLASSNLAESSAFSIDTIGPVISNINISQTAGTKNVVIHYDLADDSGDNNIVILQISSDDGSTWTVPTTSLAGDVGTGVSSDVGKTVTWNAGTDFNNQENDVMKVRILGTDRFGNIGNFVSSAGFTVDTKAPVVGITTITQEAGNDMIDVYYNITDGTMSGNFVDIQISDDGGATWNVVTTTVDGDVGAGIPSDGESFNWDAGTDYPNHEKSNMRVRVRARDYFGNQGTFDSSGNFTVDTKGPVISGVTASQAVGTSTVTINYNLNDATTSSLNVAVEISDDGGASWNVATTTLMGNVGDTQTTGNGKTVSWNANTDYPNQYNTTMQVRVRAIDSWNNVGGDLASTNFTVDTANPVISNISASQMIGTNNVVVHYDLADDITSNLTLALDVSSDNGFTWIVTSTSLTGNVGGSQSAGTNKTITWNAGTDFGNQYNTVMKVRIRAVDYYNNFGSAAQGTAFTLDTKNPVVSNVTAAQTAGTTNFVINYDLSDDTISNLTVALDISSDNGSTWSVATTTLSGNVGGGQEVGINKTITWNAGTDYSAQYKVQMKVRVRAIDNYSNVSGYVSSSAFTLDTKNPIISNLTATQNVGSTNVAISYDLAEDTSSSIAVALDISNNGGSTWTVATTTLTGNVGSGQTSGTGKSITWHADIDFDNQYQTGMRVRLHAVDIYNNQSGDIESSNFIVDTANPVISNVTASQTAGTDSVAIHYNLAENSSSSILVVLDVSSDAGFSWTVATSTLAGAVGTGQTAGTNKSVTWNAGTDFAEQFNNTMQVRVRAMDKFTNWGTYINSSDFIVDTKAPIILTLANLQTQPNAGDTTVLIGGNFTENSPDTNEFFVATNGGSYGAATVGDSNTASPADQNTVVGSILKGNNYISKVKIVHTDDYSNTISNENINPAVGYKYVKPYTPAAPTVNNPTSSTVDIVVNKNTNEVAGLEYAIYENSQNKFVQADGSLGNDAVWQTGAVWGTTTITGLSSPVATNVFQTKSRNSADFGNAPSSESALSAGASAGNNAPAISIISVAQNAGHNYVTINYTGTDNENDLTNLITYEYSLNNADWLTMTEKSGVGSSGKTNLAFTSGGTALKFVWDAAADLSNMEDASVYVRLRGNDNIINGNLAQSSAFALDLKVPVISNINVGQQVGSSTVLVTYDLADLTATSNTVIMQISSDNGVSWTVATTTLVGNIGNGQNIGTGNIIYWNAGVDFGNQNNSQMKVQLRAVDYYNNQNGNVVSNNFSVDTVSPVVSNVVAVQTTSTNDVVITYDLTDVSSSTVAIDISQDGGSNWTVADTSVVGNIGTGVTPGTGKSIIWNAGADFGGQSQSDMRVRVRATDIYNNASGNVSSANFVVDTAAATISNVSASQLGGSTNVVIAYDLADAHNATVAIDISQDGGSTWTVTDTSITGNVGAGVTPGTGKTITWNADIDFDNQYQTDMRVRVRATDIYGNVTTDVESANFILDTVNPAVTNVVATQSAGTKNVVITYDIAENNTSTVSLEISQDSGSTWTVTNTAVTGNIGIGVTPGTGKSITWNADTNFPGQAQTDMRVRVRGVDTFGNQGNYEESANFNLDTAAPVISNLSAAQSAGTNDVIITYDLADDNIANLSVALDISSNNGASWTVATSTATGNVGGSQNAGFGKNITWDAGTDYADQYSANFRVRLRATDTFSNQSNNFSSALFTVDTQAPVVTNVVASQSSGSGVVVVNYSLTDRSAFNNTVEVGISDDNGSSWNVVSTSLSGDVGANQSAGMRTFVWNAPVDFSDQLQTDMKVRVRATDAFDNQGSFDQSSAFNLDTKAPIISNLTAAQASSTDSVAIHYDLAENTNTSTVSLEMSSDGGLNWTVTAVSLTGAIGATTDGINKTITWNVGTDFAGQEKTNMRVRLHATDTFGNLSSNFSSSDFVLDTKAPAGLTTISKFSSATSSITLNWSAGVTDVHFNHYEIWHGTNQTDVNNRAGTASKWSTTNDSALTDVLTISTVITGIPTDGDYFVKIFAVDNYGHEATIPSIQVFQTAVVPTPVVVITGGGGGFVAPIITRLSRPILNPVTSPTTQTKTTISGLADPRTRVDLYDNDTLVARLNSVTNNNGEFSQDFTFTQGSHSLTVRAVDFNNNISSFSDPISLAIVASLSVTPTVVTPVVNVTPTSVTVRPAPVVTPVAPGVITGGQIATPPASLIRINTEAVEVPGLPVPAVSNVVVPPAGVAGGAVAITPVVPVGAAVNDVISFTGTALPNQDIVVYVHSDQGLIFRTRTNDKGVWQINHFQSDIELTPGDHTIFAVAIDPVSKVKSRPSAVTMFTVKRNLWATIFKYLNIQTTLVSLGVLLLTILWLYRINKKELAS